MVARLCTRQWHRERGNCGKRPRICPRTHRTVLECALGTRCGLLPSEVPTFTMPLPGAQPRDLIAGLVGQMHRRCHSKKNKIRANRTSSNSAGDIYYLTLPEFIPVPEPREYLPTSSPRTTCLCPLAFAPEAQRHVARTERIRQRHHQTVVPRRGFRLRRYADRLPTQDRSSCPASRPAHPAPRRGRCLLASHPVGAIPSSRN